jgi:hypothetical protein
MEQTSSESSSAVPSIVSQLFLLSELLKLQVTAGNYTLLELVTFSPFRSFISALFYQDCNERSTLSKIEEGVQELRSSG